MTNLTVFFAMILVVQTTYLEDVKNFTEIFATFKNDSTDLEKLIAIAENHQELAEQATKVGLLFAAAGGNNSSEPGSDEDQALEYLNNEIRRKFDILNIKRRDDRVPFSYSLYNNAHNDIIRPIWYNYQKDVSDVLELFYYDYSYSEDFFVNFGMNKEKCENPDFTQKHRFMTLRLNRAYYSGSNDIYQGMKDDIRKYVRLQQAIREAESRVKKRTSENPETIEELLDDVKARIMTFGLADDNTRYTSNDGRIQILENINPETLDDLLKELLYFSVRFPRMIPIYDLLREDRFYGFKKPDLMYAVQDLLKYQWSTIACTATKTGYSTSYIGKRISADAKEVAKVAQDYVTYYQSIGNITWPEIHVEAAKRAIGFDRIPLEKFNKTASRIQKELGKYLPEGYSYQILITEARQKDVYWVAESKTGDYAYFTDLNGIDCHIFRYRILGASERVNNATEHFEQHRQDLKNILEKSAYSESATEVMQELLQTVDFFNNEAYNSAILLRNEAFFVNNSKIYAGEAFLETNNTNSVEFSVNSFYKTARAWKFYLFI